MELLLKDKLPFGKWKGCKIEDMLSDDNFEEFSIFGRGNPVKYLQWVDKNVTNYTLSKEVLNRIKEKEKSLSKLQQEYQNKNPQKSRIDWNQWGNYDDRELSMSIQDMGYTGDGF